MKIASLAKMKAQLSAYVRATSEGPVVVTRNGKAVAVLVGVKDEDEVERLMLAHSPKLRAILDAAEERIRMGQGIPHEQFWKEVEEETKARARRKPRKKTG